MKPIDLDRLYKASLRLSGRWGLSSDHVYDEPLVPFDDPRKSVVEHVCHELGHAALLHLPFERIPPRNADLSWRIARALNRLAHRDYDKAELNEIETFAVAMRCLDRLHIAVDREVMVQQLQVVAMRERLEILAIWRHLRRQGRFRRACRRVLTAVAEEVAREHLDPLHSQRDAA